MDFQTSKIELVKLILNLDNPTILQKINQLIQDEEKDFENTLINCENEEIKIALTLLDSEKRTFFSDYLKKVS